MEKKNKNNEELFRENTLKEDSFVNFNLRYKGELFYFEFPFLYDKAFILQEIKAKTGVKRNFCLRTAATSLNDVALKKSKETLTKDQKLDIESSGTSCKTKTYENKQFSMHSSNISTLLLQEYCGKTLLLIDENGEGADTLENVDPVLAYNRRSIESRLRPFDCPP